MLTIKEKKDTMNKDVIENSNSNEKIFKKSKCLNIHKGLKYNKASKVFCKDLFWPTLDLDLDSIQLK